ncbi:MAG: hypothetical protein Q9160_002198 [Pyrenula sp. 1 TL-2023]
MGRPPAVVIIARHGARLDAADKQWHLTSPIPYDPPLTYGGWTQGRALGARIANILRAREESPNEGIQQHASSNGVGDAPTLPKEVENRRKKHKIIIHSSPFVRCVQTSIAVAAGIAQLYQPESIKETVREPTARSPDSLENDAPRQSSIAESTNQSITRLAEEASPMKLHTATLRIDAFLGEWMSPDYYKDITPPPSSVMMVAGAKSDLLRPGEKMVGLDASNTKSQGNFPGGWKNDWNEAIFDDSVNKAGLSSMATVQNALPHRNRANTDSQSENLYSKLYQANLGIPAAEFTQSTAYVPPTPAYAISSSDPIPPGYVAHARDICVDVDYQWDSMRAPYDWGDGGEYGEEWSSMHKRFRTGLQRMIYWYGDIKSSSNLDDASTYQDEEMDTVIILVTHGAGCNALIGALTNQPVLLDVGMASLTMAIRKSKSKELAPSQQSSAIRQRRSSIGTDIAEEYEVKITASTEHLRLGSNTLDNSSRTSSPRIPSGSFTSSRRPFGSDSSSDGFSIGEPLFTKSVPTNGFHRNPNNTSSLRWALNTSSLKTSTGLWGSPVTPVSDTASDSNDDSIPNFGRAGTDDANLKTDDASKLNKTNGNIPQKTGSQRIHRRDRSSPKMIGGPHTDSAEEDDTVPDQIPNPRRTSTQRGLWGGGEVMTRKAGPKRRWTVSREHA